MNSEEAAQIPRRTTRSAQIVSDLCGACCSEAIAKFSIKPMIWNCLSQLYAKDITPMIRRSLMRLCSRRFKLHFERTKSGELLQHHKMR
ncbi:uncharacterized protein DS421_16g547310 [Arachis hypogaea]|nr:uncharacterized protein DS421_16g547310 [Arachis hypogaea]